MKFQTIVRAGLVAALAMSTVAMYAADDAKTDTKDAPKTSGRSAQLIKPYSELKDLSADQQAKLKEIHAKFLAERKALESKQSEDMMAVLTDAQKKELSEIEVKDAADKKAGKSKAADKAPAASADSKATSSTESK